MQRNSSPITNMFQMIIWLLLLNFMYCNLTSGYLLVCNLTQKGIQEEDKNIMISRNQVYLLNHNLVLFPSRPHFETFGKREGSPDFNDGPRYSWRLTSAGIFANKDLCGDASHIVHHCGARYLKYHCSSHAFDDGL